ncbi:Zinc finger MYM-type protein 1 [Cyphomyrmex costatus]|uniref:Zinc finger MYM-type protein 1 n=1 Tax=Cyphomyrmex costatus TaxID=456900 RepID=A0A151IJ82_9HYME|nr:Zinc finger MYM-type protein 1 [Cyphomyrmex costatus]
MDRKAKQIDLCLAVHIAAHTAVRSIDHLGELLSVLGKGSALENIRIHRTKCSKLIKNVISPAMLTELINDIDNQKFSLIIDESTDVSVIKYLAFCVRYFSLKRKSIITDFLGFVEVERATGIILCNSTIEYLTAIGLDYKNVIGIASDGAANMIDVENGFFKFFKDKVPTVQLIKCSCHSLHLCLSKAAEQLPADLEFLVRESRNWFANSPLRRIQYESLYSAINKGDMPLKLVQLVKTRWLAWSKAINVLIEQWLELKTHFNIHIRSLNPSDKCTVGRKLRELYNDETNYLYLLFIKPITNEFNRINLKFQLNSTEVISLVRHILKPSFIKINNEGKFLTAEAFELLRNALNNPEAYLPLNSIDYGASFTIHLGRVNLPCEVLNDMKQRCVNYLSVLCKQLVERLPTNINHFETLQYLTPDECLNPCPNRVDFFKLPLFLTNLNDDVDVLKTQWDKLNIIDFRSHFDDMIPQNSEKFWIGILDYKDSSGCAVFSEIAKFAPRVLSLPFSNAFVERTFSFMNAIKTKARNRMSIEILMAIMRVRIWFAQTNECCNKFVPNDRMYELFTSQMYVELEQVATVDGENEDVSILTRPWKFFQEKMN